MQERHGKTLRRRRWGVDGGGAWCRGLRSLLPELIRRDFCIVVLAAHHALGIASSCACPHCMTQGMQSSRP